MFDKSLMHHYQPGYTCIAGGVWSGCNTNKRVKENRTIMRSREELLNPKINWIRENVKDFDPVNNTVTSESD